MAFHADQVSASTSARYLDVGRSFPTPVTNCRDQDIRHRDGRELVEKVDVRSVALVINAQDDPQRTQGSLQLMTAVHEPFLAEGKAAAALLISLPALTVQLHEAFRAHRRVRAARPALKLMSGVPPADAAQVVTSR